ncbi:MAG: substrate-binding domain-containing protein [Geodermatophilaceae bacterium]|nr:substrate-binding domain-containing protein [Geodermatophilaceae bacterium]
MPVKKVVMALAMTSALLLAGCSGTGQEDDSSGSEDLDLTIAVITHSGAGDAFWDVVKSGADQAGSDLGVTVDYSNDADPVRQSELIDNAVSQGVDGIVVSMANPDGVRDSVEAAVGAGIPVITINSGIEQSAAFGAITHVGQSESIAGQAVGQRLNDEGATGKVVCVIHEAGNIGLEERCSSVGETFDGSVENLQVDGTNVADVQDTILSKLQSDPDVGVILTLGGQFGIAAADAQADAGTDAIIGTFDVSEDVLNRITDGDILFAVDQQPYVQGYLGVQLLYLKVRNGNDVGGGQPVLSGPAFVDAENAAAVLEFASNGTR